MAGAARQKLAFIDISNFLGLNSKSTTTLSEIQSLEIAKNTDFFTQYGGISKPPGSKRILSAQYTESGSAKQISWIGFYKAADLDGQILRHVLCAAGTKLHKLETDGTLTALTGAGLPVTETRTEGLFHSADKFNDLYFIQNQNPDLIGAGNTPVKYDGLQIQRWGIVPPGSAETVQETFNNISNFTLSGGTGANESTTTLDGNAIKVTATGTTFTIDRTGLTAFSVDNTIANRGQISVYIPRGQLPNFSDGSSTVAISVRVGTDVTANYHQFDFQKGVLIEGWNNLALDFSDPSATVGSPGVSALTAFRVTINSASASLLATNIRLDKFLTFDKGTPTAAEGATGSVFASGGVRSYKVTYVSKYGHEALALDTPIFTTAGWKKISDIQVGDKVFDETGHECNVIKTTEVFYNRPCFEIEFSNNEKVISDAGHQWLTHSKKFMRYWADRNSRDKLQLKTQPKKKRPIAPDILTTNELFNSEFKHFKVPIARPILFANRSLLIDPYLLGVWLGDGTKGTAEITSIDEEIVNSFRVAGWKVTSEKNPYHYYIGTPSNLPRHLRNLTTGRIIGSSGYSFKSKLKALDLLKNKHIPDLYLTSSIAQRFELLRGLMDTDGSVDKNGSCTFSNSDPKLIEGVKFLLSTLGIKHATHKDNRNNKTSRCKIGQREIRKTKISMKVYFRVNSETPVFKLNRKLIKQKDITYKYKVNHLSIKSIKPVTSVPVKCISVDSPSHLFLAGQYLTPTHNSNAGPASVDLTTTAARASLTLTGIPVSTDPQILSRRLYRSVASGAIHLFLATIDNNTDTTYTDTTGDTGLGDTSPPLEGDISDDNSPPPKAGIVKKWKDTLFLAGLPDRPENVLYSDVNEPESFPTLNNVQLDAKVTAIYETYSGLVVETELGKWQVTGDNPDFRFDKIINNIGCVGRRAAGETRIQGWTIDREGMRLYDLNSPTKISEVIRDKFDEDFDKSNIELIHSTHSKSRNGITLFVPNAAGEYKSNNYVYQYPVDSVERGWWWQLDLPTSLNILHIQEIEDNNGDFHLYAGDAAGMIFELFALDQKNWVRVDGTAEAITTQFQTKYIRAASSDQEGEDWSGRITPRFIEVRWDGDDDVTWTILIETANGPDQTTATDSTTVTITFGEDESLLRYPINPMQAGEYVRLTFTNSDLNKTGTITGVRLAFIPKPGQFSIESTQMSPVLEQSVY